MQTINLKIDDSFDFENNYPKSVVVSSVEDVRKRVFEAEKEIGINEEQYNKLMDKFFTEELGIKR